MTHIQSPIHLRAAALEHAHRDPEGRRVEMLRGGDRVVVRPLHADDIELERRFIENLSPASRRFRFLETMVSPSDALLKQLTVINHATDAAFVALIGEGAHLREIGVARLSATPDGHDCEFAVVVSDAWQNKGLGTLLMRRLIEVARARGIQTLHSSDAADNDLMRKFAEHLQLDHRTDRDDAALITYSIDLGAPAS